MDPDDGSADPLEDVSRTTPLGDPPTFTSDDDEGRGGSRRGGRPSRKRLPQHKTMSAPHHRPAADESSQPGQLPTARPSWGDVHDIYDDDDTEECDHSPGDRSREDEEEEATVASLSTMDTETFKRLRDHRRLLKGSGNSDSTEVTRNDRYRDRGEGRGSSRRRRRRDDDTATYASHSYAPSHHSYNSHNSHHTASTASSEAPAYGHSRRGYGHDRSHGSRNSRRSKKAGTARYPIPWQAVLLFALGTVLMAKMGVIELKLEKSQGRFLRGGEELVDEMNYRVGGVEVVRQRREEDVSAEEGGEEVQSEGEGEGEEKEIPKGDADKESAVDELLGEDEAKREGIEYSKAVEPVGNAQSGGNEQREADALSAQPDLSPDKNPEVAPAFATDSKEPPSEQYFRKSLEELIQRMDSQRGGNADDDSFQADETPQQQPPESNVDEKLEKLALEQDREARQEQAQLIEERQRHQPLLNVNAGMDEQRHASAAAAAFGLNPDRSSTGQNVGLPQQQSESQQFNGGLAEWQAQYDHSHGQNPQQLQPQPLQQSAPDVSVSEHLRNLPLFSQGHSGNQLHALQEKQLDLQAPGSQIVAQDNGLQLPQQPVAPQQLEPLSPDQIQQQIQLQQPQQLQQQAHQEQHIQQGTYQNQNLDGPPQQQQQPYTYVQQQVPLVGQQPHVAPPQNVIIGQQAHQRGDTSQFAVVGGSFVHAIDADGNVVNDPNAASGGGHLLASKASRGMQPDAGGAPVPDASRPEANAEGAAEAGESDGAQQGAPDSDASGPNSNASPEADAGEEDGVDLLSKDPFHNDSRHFRQEAPLHLFTEEEKKKLATLEKEEEQQQAQTGDTQREVAGNEAKEEPAQPPKRSVDDGIAHDNPRLWGVK